MGLRPVRFQGHPKDAECTQINRPSQSGKVKGNRKQAMDETKQALKVAQKQNLIELKKIENN